MKKSIAIQVSLKNILIYLLIKELYSKLQLESQI